MKQYILLFSCICIYLFPSCREKPEFILKSETTDISYNINNKLAATRLYSLMYNQEDSLKPIERFKMVHISDAHLSPNSGSNKYTSPKNLIEAVKFSNQQELRINAMVATGDHINYAKKSEAQLSLNSFYQHLFENNVIPTFPCYGNHDSNTLEKETEEVLLKKELHTSFSNYRNYDLQRESGENYYYTDVKNPMGGFVRIIALDMLDQSAFEYNTVSQAIFSQKQIDWLCNKALTEDMTNGHSVIVITHYPFESYSKSKNISTFLVDGKFVHSSQLIPEIIEAFRQKSTLKKEYPNVIDGRDTIYVDKDFSSSRGDFICYMGGHIHATTQFEVTNISNRSTTLPPQKMLLCTNMSPSEMGKVFNRVKRVENTIADNSFCLYAIDTKERNIYITFFGAYLPVDKTAEEYPETQVISY